MNIILPLSCNSRQQQYQAIHGLIVLGLSLFLGRCNLGSHFGTHFLKEWRKGHGETDASQKKLGQVVVEDAMATGKAESDEGKFSTLAQNQSNLLGDRLVNSECHGDSSSDDSLRGEDSSDNRCNKSGLICDQLKINLESYCEEEKTDQNSTEDRDLLFDSMSVFGLRKQDTSKESSKSVGES